MKLFNEVASLLPLDEVSQIFEPMKETVAVPIIYLIELDRLVKKLCRKFYSSIHFKDLIHDFWASPILTLNLAVTKSFNFFFFFFFCELLRSCLFYGILWKRNYNLDKWFFKALSWILSMRLFRCLLWNIQTDEQ